MKEIHMKKVTIIIIEDDPIILKANRKALEMQGYCIICAETLTKGHTAIVNTHPDLVILDILLPDGNGLEYCRELRGTSIIPILFLSALGTSNHILAGLRAGGDDYISKPYDMDIFLAKVEAILRRCTMQHAGKSEEDKYLYMGNLYLDMISRRAYLKDSDLLLKPREFAVLEVLVRQGGTPIEAKELYERIWALDPTGDIRTIYVHISSLRSKLGYPVKTGAPFLLSNRKSGYYLSLYDV